VKETNQEPLFSGFWPKLCIREQSRPGENHIGWRKMKRLHAGELQNKCFLIIRLKVKIVFTNKSWVWDFEAELMSYVTLVTFSLLSSERKEKMCYHQQSNLSSLRLWHITRSEWHQHKRVSAGLNVTDEYFGKFLKKNVMPKNSQQQARIVHSLCTVFA
jgi:hypothetical protein